MIAIAWKMNAARNSWAVYLVESLSGHAQLNRSEDFIVLQTMHIPHLDWPWFIEMSDLRLRDIIVIFKSWAMLLLLLSFPQV